MNVPVPVHRDDRKGVLKTRAGRTGVSGSRRKGRAAISRFEELELVRASARGKCRVDVAVVLIDGNVVFARKTANGAKHHRRTKGLSSVCGFREPQPSIRGGLIESHVDGLQAVGGDPLPIVDWDAC